MIEWRRALRAVTGHRLRRVSSGSVGVGGTHCYDVGIVSRRAYGGITIRTGSVVLPHVSGSDDDDDAGFPGRFHCLAKGIERIALIHSAGQRKIDDPDVVLAPGTASLLDG